MPTKTAFKKPKLLLAYSSGNIYLKHRKPPNNGKTTPNTATRNDAKPLFLSSSKSVSRPAINIRRITPISEAFWIKSVYSIKSRKDGPSMMPEIRAPTTAGNWTRLEISPKNFVDKSITAKENRYKYLSSTFKTPPILFSFFNRYFPIFRTN